MEFSGSDLPSSSINLVPDIGGHDWNVIVQENEKLRIPGELDATESLVYSSMLPEVTEIHIDDLIIRVPVKYFPPMEKITTAEVGVDAPLRLKSMPPNLEMIPVNKDFSKIDEGNIKTFILNELAGLLNINDYRQNLYSFWILDSLGTIIWEAQKKDMSTENLLTLINWFFYFLRSIKNTHLSRKGFFEVIRALLVQTDEWMVFNSTSSVPIIFGVKLEMPIQLQLKTKPEDESSKEKTGELQGVAAIDSAQSIHSQIFYKAEPSVLDGGQDLKTYANQLYNV